MFSGRTLQGSRTNIYDLSPPHGRITDNDHGGYVVITAWIMMCFFSLSVITRILTRFMPVRVYGMDDVVIGLATVRLHRRALDFHSLY
jgi:hypothetical protein